MNLDSLIENISGASSAQPEFMIGVVLLGIGVGVLTGLFGIGGAFIATPILISLFAVDPTTAVGCMLGYTVGAGMLGIKNHKEKGNVEWRAMSLIAGGTCIGTLLGFFVHQNLAAKLGSTFEHVISASFLLILVFVAWLTSRQKNELEQSNMVKRFSVPPYVTLASGNRVSLILLMSCGLAVGLLKGTFGIGGGIILIPLMIFVVGLKPHAAVGTSLGVVLLSSLVGTALYAQHIDWLMVGLLISGGIAGVKIGSHICTSLAADQLRKAFATVMLLAATLLTVNLSYDIIQSTGYGFSWTTTTIETPSASSSLSNGMR